MKKKHINRILIGLLFVGIVLLLHTLFNNTRKAWRFKRANRFNNRDTSAFSFRNNNDIPS